MSNYVDLTKNFALILTTFLFENFLIFCEIFARICFTIFFRENKGLLAPVPINCTVDGMKFNFKHIMK